MGVNLSIKDVPDDIAERLRQRAARHHRSLQGELMHIVSEAAAQPAPEPASGPGATGAGRVRKLGWMTVEDLAAQRRAASWQPHPSMANVARSKQRQGVPRDVARSGLELLLQHDIDLHDVDPMPLLTIAETCGLTACDAAYLWLAAELKAPLATFDRRLADAARNYLGQAAPAP